MSQGSPDPDCAFCAIVAKKLPANIVYEDDHVLAFLDIAPLTKGHTLIIPKAHYANLPSLPPDEMSHVGRVLPKVCAAVIKGVEATDFNVMQNNGKRAGQVVFHVHFHIFPRSEKDPTQLGKMIKIKREKIDADEAKSIVRAIKACL